MTCKALAILASLLAVAFLVTPAMAEEGMRIEPVRFPPGGDGTTIEGSAQGRDLVLHRLGAEAGQRLSVVLTTDNPSTYFNVYAPGRGPGDEALAVGGILGPQVPEINRFDGVLPASGTYTISVYLVRAAARRGERFTYVLDLSLTGEREDLVRGDYADGLQGGPDFWSVRAGNGLNLRSGPSRAAPILRAMPNGLVVRNLGCRMNEARRWCRVAIPGEPVLEGWAAGDYLAESGGPGAAAEAATGDALVPGTPFHATGQVPCATGGETAPMRCDAGVVRQGGGSGSVFLTLPDGRRRTVLYRNGIPVGSDGSSGDGAAPFEARREGDAYRVSVGPDRFLIPDALIFGG